MDTLIWLLKSKDAQFFGMMFLVALIPASICTWVIGRKLQTLGRIRMKKKYQICYVNEAGYIAADCPVAESNSFRGIERLRNTVVGKVAIVFENTAQEVANASN